MEHIENLLQALWIFKWHIAIFAAIVFAVVWFERSINNH